MNERPRQILVSIMARYGHDLADDPQRCEALLRDFCGGEYPLEVRALIGPMKEGIVADMKNSYRTVPYEVLRGRLTKRLQQLSPVTDEAAQWSVESWALALGIVSTAPAESSLVRESEAEAVQALPALEAFQHPTTIIPLFVAVMSIIFLVFFSDSVGGALFATILSAVSGVVAISFFIWRYFLRS